MTQPAIKKTLRKVSALMRANKLDQSKKILETACKAHPEIAVFWGQLSTVYGRSGNFEAAASCAARGAALEPNHPGHSFNLATALIQTGHYAEAIEPLEKTIALDPKNADAMSMLVDVYGKTGKLKDALIAAGHLAGLRPNDVNALKKLAHANYCMTRFEQSRKIYNRVLSVDPHHWPAHTGIARNLCREGQMNEAIPILQRVLEHRPGDPVAISDIAQAYELLGDDASAWQTVNSVEPGDTPLADLSIIYSRLASRIGKIDEAIHRLETTLDKGRVTTGTTRGLHFQLGKLYEKKCRYDTAFSHYKTANKNVASGFTPENDRKHFEQIKTGFSRDVIRTAARSSITTSLPVFVVGMPRSGTSLVEQILDSHSGIGGAGELDTMRSAALEALPSLTHPGEPVVPDIERLTTARLDDIASAYLAKLKSTHPHASRVVDKLPHNFQRLGFINLVFPNTPIINCVRDPRDTCLSIFTNPLSYWHGYAHDLSELGAYYNRYQDLMTHWEQVIDNPILTVQYENLVVDPEAEIRRILEFLGMEWETGCLEFHKNTRYTRTISYDQVRQPLNSGSIGRWRKFEQQLAPLLETLDIADM